MTARALPHHVSPAPRISGAVVLRPLALVRDDVAAASPVVLTQPAPPAERLLSIDALRGFNMFWIIGAERFVEALRHINSTGALGFVGYQLEHSPWQGFRFYDLILPLFIFLMGAAIPFSLGRISAVDGRRAASARIFRRAALLYVIGVLYYRGFDHSLADVRVLGVLQRIAICYLVASLLYLHLSLRGMIAVCASLLVAYWAFLSFVPAPGMSHVSFAPHENWPNYIDQHFLPGRLWNKTWDPEGLLSTIPAVSTALLGVFAGILVKSRAVSDRRKVMSLAVAGTVAVVFGFAWGLQFPVIKNIWTSSFALVAAGYSALLLAAFYWIIDVRKQRAWATPLFWIGSNALAIYVGVSVLNFQAMLRWLVSGTLANALGVYAGLFVTLAALYVEILVLGVLYRKRIFLRL